MKIQRLIETDLFRADDRWVGDERDTFVVLGRTSRTPVGSFVSSALLLAYACELNNIDCPRRWRSTFCTSSPHKSTFLSLSRRTDLRDEPNLRRIVPREGTKLAYVYDDFNLSELVTSIESVVGQVITTISELILSGAVDSSDVPNFKEKYRVYDVIQNDSLYEEFKRDWVTLSEIIAAHRPELSLLRTAKECITNALRNDAQFGVVDSIDDVPSGNYEVWFEGEYEVHKIT